MKFKDAYIGQVLDRTNMPEHPFCKLNSNYNGNVPNAASVIEKNGKWITPDKWGGDFLLVINPDTEVKPVMLSAEKKDARILKLVQLSKAVARARAASTAS